ncbi:MAG: HAMP domain-containing histidine kinase [Clostridia bacterium]|nr:HAMP domain-containing histidine kinase [Clostridia bacterium]
MKKNPVRKYRFSLALMFSGIVLAVLLLTSVIVAVVVFYLVYRGTLKIGDNELDFGSFILVMTLLNLGIGFVIYGSTSRFSLIPINRILNAINKVAAGDYTARVTFKNPFAKIPTINEYTNSFNAMASQLEMNKVVHTDFINNFSHEFKTPIVSIAGFAKLLRREDLPEEKRKEYLQIIEEESVRLAQMAENVLNLTKVENQTVLSDVSEFNLSEQIRNSFLVLEAKWVKKNLEPVLLFDEYDVQANEELLMQVWINLIDNAIKFAYEKSEIQVSIDKKTNGYEIKVSNFGDTIPEESLGRIYDRFYQADSSHSTEGNGVGLAVVKKIVDLHKGEINVRSENNTTVFTVFLPQ